MRITSKEYKDAQRALNYSMSNIVDNMPIAKRPNLNLDAIMKQTNEVMAQNNKIAGLVANTFRDGDKES